MLKSVGVALFLLSNLLGAAADSQTIRMCTVQSDERFAGVILHGTDAKRLAQELSTRKLHDGSPVLAIPITGIPKNETGAAIERENCAYVISISRHENVDIGNGDVPGAIADPNLPTAPHAAPIGDRDLVAFSLKKIGSNKVIAHGIAPPPTYHRPDHHLTEPYPLFADEILKKIDQKSK